MNFKNNKMLKFFRAKSSKKGSVTMSKRTVVFMGGTLAGSNWREILGRMVKSDNVELLNPTVGDWNEEAQQKGIEMRESCDYCLYVVTPRMEGVYSIAEVVDDSNKRPEKTLFCFTNDVVDDMLIEFEADPEKSLRAVAKMVHDNGGQYFESLDEVATFLNAVTE